MQDLLNGDALVAFSQGVSASRLFGEEGGGGGAGVEGLGEGSVGVEEGVLLTQEPLGLLVDDVRFEGMHLLRLLLYFN